MPGTPKGLILASASPRRRELLERLGLAFRVLPADVDEELSSPGGPAAMVLVNAALKAVALSAHYPDFLILGSDTTVALNGEVLNKPSDLDEARAMLRRLSGRRHTVFTAVALHWERGSLQESFVESSEVRFKNFDDGVIERYFEQVNPLDKAGAYGIQHARDLIIESVEGSVENVMGLPLQRLEIWFSEHGFDFRV